MLTLSRPQTEHQVAYEAARERFQDHSYVARLIQGQGAVLALGLEYEERAVQGDLNLLASNGDVQPHIIDGDMQKLYTQGLLRKNSEARKIYEKIKLSSPFRVCPFCLHRSVKTIDHYLPKERFAAYSVLPVNLIPCCRDCNTEKLAFFPQDRSEMLLHPYFDHVDDAQWLGCDLVFEDGGWRADFFVYSANVDVRLRDRLINHLRVLDLFSLYDIEGSREINEITLQIGRSYENGGADSVGDLCREMAASRSVLARNYWRSVVWMAAANSPDFCNADWAL